MITWLGKVLTVISVRQVAHQKWEDTVHVEHYRKYPAQYASIVERFVSQIKERASQPRLQ